MKQPRDSHNPNDGRVIGGGGGCLPFQKKSRREGPPQISLGLPVQAILQSEKVVLAPPLKVLLPQSRFDDEFDSKNISQTRKDQQHSCPNSTPAKMKEPVSQNAVHASCVMLVVFTNELPWRVRPPGLSLCSLRNQWVESTIGWIAHLKHPSKVQLPGNVVARRARSWWLRLEKERRFSAREENYGKKN